MHWKWSQRITRLLIQCLESTEYMEIQNALLLLTKNSSVFPVTRKSGINLEKRVGLCGNMILYEVLATGVAAALAARKPSWITEEFGMGYLELKPAPSLASKSLGSAFLSSFVLFLERWSLPTRSVSKQPTQDLGKDDNKSGKAVGRTSGSSSNIERDLVHPLEGRPGGTANVSSLGAATGSTLPTSVKSSTQSVKLLDIRGSEPKVESVVAKSSDLRAFAVKYDSTDVSDVQRPPSFKPVHSSRHDNSIIASKSGDKPQKRVSPAEEPDRQNKRRKGETDSRDLDGRRDEDGDRRFGTARHSQRLSPMHEEREWRRSEENRMPLFHRMMQNVEEKKIRKREEREGLSVKMYDREWDDEKRQRAEPKRRHR
ncbi:similar to THO2 [Actinidia rufa]|uniref:Similar to THO2 n=1 Tax=Actinidia rufa TaxID=165716 RepID=A0A7J0FVC0_9ERIC|nr:similar to THO2 [Actinidia rufa]